MKSKYVHTNLIAADWRKLADFYLNAFDCELVPPERDYAGDALDRGTGLHNARLRGAHLRLPGYGADGPTLEIYSYDAFEKGMPPAANRQGLGHLAFEVEDVFSAAPQVVALGGSTLGEIVVLRTKFGAEVTWCYMADPEGNMLELQSWQNR